jgi:hypothetical protein
MTGAALELLRMVDGHRTWGEIVQQQAARQGMRPADAEARLRPVMAELQSEEYVLFRQ